MVVIGRTQTGKWLSTGDRKNLSRLYNQKTQRFFSDFLLKSLAHTDHPVISAVFEPMQDLFQTTGNRITARGNVLGISLESKFFRILCFGQA
tara:strand:- start:983 stop:1258 length:276 start_codon:yes stop_codon:yes gene_type:complete